VKGAPETDLAWREWQDTRCFKCGEPFLSIEEFADAHVAHDKDCPFLVDDSEECHCTKLNHARCCPWCNGDVLQKSIEMAAGDSDQKLVDGLNEVLANLFGAEEALEILEMLPDTFKAEDIGFPSIQKVKQDIHHFERASSLIEQVIRARGIELEVRDHKLVIKGD
jgi:hypothetical protein